MAIEAVGLMKTYHKRRVVNGVNLLVNPGEVVGLLGPNGAGKTTSFYMIVGLVKPDGGRILMGGGGHLEDAHAQAGPFGHQLSAPGIVDLPEALGGGQYHGRPRVHGHSSRR